MKIFGVFLIWIKLTYWNLQLSHYKHLFWYICTWLYHIVKGLVKRAFRFVSASFIPKFHVWICHVVVYYISCEGITIIGIIQWYLSLLYLQIHKQPVVCKMKNSGLLYSQQKHVVVHFCLRTDNKMWKGQNYSSQNYDALWC